MYLLSLNLPIILRPKKCIIMYTTGGGNPQSSKTNKSRLSDEENGAGVQVTLGRACGHTRCLYPSGSTCVTHHRVIYPECVIWLQLQYSPRKRSLC